MNNMRYCEMSARLLYMECTEVLSFEEIIISTLFSVVSRRLFEKEKEKKKRVEFPTPFRPRGHCKWNGNGMVRFPSCVPCHSFGLPWKWDM